MDTTLQFRRFSLRLFAFLPLFLHVWTYNSCFAAPVLAPDIAFCHLQPVDAPYNCCAPPSHKPPIEFQLPSSPAIRLRRPAHLVTSEYASKLSRAYQLMKELPHDDPRSFGHQANIHCAYCNEFYAQGNSSIPLQVHGSWLFFSFHRWYLYFHERILARLLGDDSFALPFWNYDHPDGSTMPHIYMEYPALSNDKRQPSHVPPTVVEIDAISWGRADRTNEDQLNVNRAAMYWIMITGATTQYRFFGQPYRSGDDQMPGYGTAETMPHNSVHAWTGNMHEDYHDMGIFSTAARDPMFYAHHANLDRLWEVWKTLADSNKDIDDPDYLDSEFVFYDENADLVKVRVRDSLNASRLGYLYEEVENRWLYQPPTAQSTGAAHLGDAALVCTFDGPMEHPCSASVARNHLKRSAESYNSDDETLVIGGIQVDSAPMQFNVFVNLPSANTSTSLNCTEFAGAFSSLVAGDSIPSSLRLSIGSIVKELDLSDEENLVVTVVPQPEPPFVLKIATISVEYEDTVHKDVQDRSYVL